MIRQLARDARGAPRVLQGARAGLAGIAHPDRAVRAGLRFGNSLRRVIATPEAGASPLLRGRSLSWRFAALDFPFADLRSASKAAGGSVNDAFLAALLGAFRIYHDQLGAPIESMPIAIPISVRREGDAKGGNRFVAARLAAPVAIRDPAERIAAVRSLVRAARAEPAIEALAMMATPLSRLPGWLISTLAGGMTKNNDLQASNVPGIREEIYIAGARIERIYPYAPLPGSATMITLTTCGETCCIGVNLDPAAITDQERFGACLKEGFDEVLGLGSGAGRAVLRA
jgi:WS/DGAT/MGAT family acyltransferase